MKKDPSSEVAELSRRHGAPAKLDFVLDDVSFKPLGGKRKAEVAMAIQRPNGKILLQTKEFYPRGLFRLPTGGLKAHERIEAALLRETEEETALAVEVRDFVAILDYHSRAKERVFRTYLFLLDECGGVLRAQEPKEKITGWLEADRVELESTATNLRESPEPWRAWGHFRALVVEALLARQSTD